ncbi:hypothetical protein Tco_1378921 [Tanacetum coccineum]
MDDETTADEQAYSSGDEVGRDHILTVNLRQSWWKPLTKDRPATPEPAWTFPSSGSDYANKQTGPLLKLTYALHRRTTLYLLKPEDMALFRIDRRAVRTHMRILSVVRIYVFSMYGYNYMKKIVLRRADLKEYVIAKRDFKYMYPSDFEDLYLLNLQGHLNHLSPEDKKILTTAVILFLFLWTRNLVSDNGRRLQLGIESYRTAANLTKPRWEAIGFKFKHDFTIIDSPRAAIFRDKYGVQMIMRFNEIHKFSDGTLQQMLMLFDYRSMGIPDQTGTIQGMNARFWTKKDVDRSKDFMFAIQK